MGSPRSRNDLDFVDETADKTKDRLHGLAASASDNFTSAADQVVEAGRALGRQGQKALNEFKPFVERSAREQPMMTLAAIAAVGFLLGALWKR